MNQKELMRFYAKVHIDEQTGCWLWQNGLNSKGYAQFWCNGHNNLGHRVSFEHFVGAIPENMQLDHKCQNERCVNPTHLEIVTGAENLLRKFVVRNMAKLIAVYWVAPVAIRS